MGRAKEALKRYNHVTLGRGRLREQGKLLGIDEDWVEELRRLVPYVIVEADGARRLPIKAPSEGEPVIPPSTTLLLRMRWGSPWMRDGPSGPRGSQNLRACPWGSPSPPRRWSPSSFTPEGSQREGPLRQGSFTS